MVDTIIIPLAGFNDEQEKLSILSIQRLEKSIQVADLYRHKNVKIVLSGGFGQHFNPTDKTHAQIQKEYLVECLRYPQEAVGKGSTGMFDNISNTVEEAIALYEELVCPNSILHNSEEIVIITSPFHFERSKYLMEVAHSKAKQYAQPVLSVVKSDPVPIKENDSNKDDTTFLNPKVPKAKQDYLYRHFMSGISETQQLALEEYERYGLQVLKTRPYGAWLDFVNKY